jgi:hypothetical protein
LSWLWLPHPVTWRPQRDVPKGGYANDGTGPSEEPPAQIDVFLEPKTSAWVTSRYEVEINHPPYLMIGNADDLERMQMGDLIEWEGKTLKLATKPLVYRFGDANDSAEVIVTDQGTGGRN